MPELILVNGGMGSGKSTVTKLLASKYSSQNYYLKIDDLIWNFYGGLDKNDSNILSFKLSHSITKTLLQNGITVFVEKVMNEIQINDFNLIAKECDVKFTQIILEISLELAINRISERRKNEVKIIDEEYLDRVIKSHNITSDIKSKFPNQVIISTERLLPETICNQILNILNHKK